MDSRCPYFGLSRGELRWVADAQALRDTQAGTGGAVPHYQQVQWKLRGVTRSGAERLVLDGVEYFVGRGNPGNPCDGEHNNCLIDSLRQCLGITCDRKKVRQDLMAAYGHATGRAKVTSTSYLDVDSHWKALLTSLFRHNEDGLPASVELDWFCVVALYRDRPDNGVVLGDIGNPRVRRLVVLNTRDMHFDPCLRLQVNDRVIRTLQKRT